MKKDDFFEVFFDDKARSVLFSLVDNRTPEVITFEDSNDISNPTISAVFNLFDQLMITNTPDLYLSEWLKITEAVKQSPNVSPYFRLMDNIFYLQQSLVMMLEDTGDSTNKGINCYELSLLSR